MKRQPVPQEQVLAWLLEHHPELHAVCEIERSWLWFDYDLRGDHNKPIRESIKEYGFCFCKRGHTLPNGKIAHWAHSCDHPIGFHRKGKGKGKFASASTSSSPELSPEELAALCDV